MAAGLGDQAILTGGDSERDTGDLDQLSLNPPVRREDKKTNQQRRKERERKNKVNSMKIAKNLKYFLELQSLKFHWLGGILL